MESFKTLSMLSFKANPIRTTSCKPRDVSVKNLKLTNYENLKSEFYNKVKCSNFSKFHSTKDPRVRGF